MLEGAGDRRPEDAVSVERISEVTYWRSSDRAAPAIGCDTRIESTGALCSPQELFFTEGEADDKFLPSCFFQRAERGGEKGLIIEVASAFLNFTAQRIQLI